MTTAKPVTDTDKQKYLEEGRAFEQNISDIINPICTGGFGLFLSTGGGQICPPYVKFSEPPLNENIWVYILLA